MTKGTRSLTVLAGGFGFNISRLATVGAVSFILQSLVDLIRNRSNQEKISQTFKMSISLLSPKRRE